jgi:Ala-tRNA(Pro) deacylase
MPSRKLKEYLDQQKVKYVSIQHSPAYTAQEVAASVHLARCDLAKTVVLKVEGEMAMAVLPADRKILLADFREVLGTSTRVRFASEAELKDLFPDCEIGAMPPFGNLYGMEVYVAPSLAAEAQLTFNAGTHTEVIQMAYQDFERLVQPKVLIFTT